MIRIFIRTPEFENQLSKLELEDETIRNIEKEILSNPSKAPVIQGTGGLRKLRWATSNKGKSGGIRVLYIDIEEYKKVYLITVYKKSKKDDLTEKEKKIIKEMVETLKKECKEDKENS